MNLHRRAQLQRRQAVVRRLKPLAQPPTAPCPAATRAAEETCSTSCRGVDSTSLRGATAYTAALSAVPSVGEALGSPRARPACSYPTAGRMPTRCAAATSQQPMADLPACFAARFARTQGHLRLLKRRQVRRSTPAGMALPHRALDLNCAVQQLSRCAQHRGSRAGGCAHGAIATAQHRGECTLSGNAPRTGGFRRGVTMPKIKSEEARRAL